MNLLLADPFALAQEYPENLTHTLNYGRSTCIRFNRKGDYLASGLADGTVIVFDFDTYGIARVLRGHTRAVQSLSWSRDGRYLLSSSRDWKCILWDLYDGSRERTVHFESAIWTAELHPFNHLIFVVALFEDEPQLVDCTEKSARKHLLSSEPLTKTPGEESSGRAGDEIDEDSGENTMKGRKQDVQSTLVVTFTRSGQYIFSGTSKGWLNVIDTETCQTLRSEKFTAANIKHIVFSKSGKQFAVNSSDRAIRLFNTPDMSYMDPVDWEIEVLHKFQDVVNRLQWNAVAFSANGDYVLASTYEDAHDVYIWETTVGSLVKIIEAPREEIVDVQWHPNRTLLAATGLEKGTIYVWATVTPQRWSALAPDFVEVDENVDYQEREDEFDIIPDEIVNKRKLDQEDEDDVDVVTIERVRGEYSDESFVIPVVLDEMDDENFGSSDSE
ncbi:WD40-repeat-containing domain protein [Limtongia smithiae]|uniref:WD40-repeat-containing domain protein n=1 Tax=Limtongia smithiae TaxID=1125753 RepID=UPI0034CEAABD